MPHKDPDVRREYMRNYVRAWKQRNPEKARAQVERWRQRNPGAEKERRLRIRLEASLTPRTLACDICGDLCKTVWDHCHDCGEHRGWLCNRCNSTLGYLNDDQALLERMAAYIRRHRFFQEQNTA